MSSGGIPLEVSCHMQSDPNRQHCPSSMRRWHRGCKVQGGKCKHAATRISKWRVKVVGREGLWFSVPWRGIPPDSSSHMHFQYSHITTSASHWGGASGRPLGRSDISLV